MEHISNAHFYCLGNFDFERTQNTQNKNQQQQQWLARICMHEKLRRKKTFEKNTSKKGFEKSFPFEMNTDGCCVRVCARF